MFIHIDAEENASIKDFSFLNMYILFKLECAAEEWSSIISCSKRAEKALSSYSESSQLKSVQGDAVSK